MLSGAKIRAANVRECLASSWQRGRKMVSYRTVGVVIDYQVVSLETHTKSSKRILCGLKSEKLLTSLNIFISLKYINLHSINVSTV